MMESIRAKGAVASDYEAIGRRIQRLVSAPKVQRVQWVVVNRRDDEPLEGWDKVLQEIKETDGIQIERLEDGAVRIGWQRYIDN